MINYEVLNNWIEFHRVHGGRFVRIPDIRKYVVHDPDQTPQLYKRFANLSREQVEQFARAEVLDNAMQDRNLMEDASKIWYLENETINFLPQVIHEPWRDRWRAHPGSGRFDVLARRGGPVPGIYIYFNEPGYGLPKHQDLTFLELEDIVEQICFTVPEHIDFVSYPAFSDYAEERDSEWKPVQPLAYPDYWEFIRWSEGRHFLNYKRQWRQCAVDLWDHLNV
jgi:hypothetical protein